MAKMTEIQKHKNTEIKKNVADNNTFVHIQICFYFMPLSVL